jgi:hypothetical protein
MEYNMQYSLDMSKKSCSCGVWYDTGVPCIHSLWFIMIWQRKIGLTSTSSEFFPPDFYSLKYFSPSSLTATTKNMFSDVPLLIVLPTEQDVRKFLPFATITKAPCAIDEFKMVRQTRIRSQGEGSAPGAKGRNVSSKKVNELRVTCTVCNTVMRRDTLTKKHPISRCDAMKKRAEGRVSKELPGKRYIVTKFCHEYTNYVISVYYL